MREAVDVIIQARIDSSRLPRKVTLPIEGKPLLAHIVERLMLSEYTRKIIVATTQDSFAPLRHILSDYGFVKFYVGSKDNVLERYYLAAKSQDTRVVVRVTADNPLTCPEFLDSAVEYHLEAEADLTHFLGIPLGTGVEVISTQALALAYKCANLTYDTEHVTPFIYKNRQFFKVLEPTTHGLYYAPDIRVTVDTSEDLHKVRGIFHQYRDKSFISMEDIINFERSNYPETHSLHSERVLA
jgi:spore coat polysaccharide biosynthesis protein SpsF